jgi:hypothetical protein
MDWKIIVWNVLRGSGTLGWSSPFVMNFGIMLDKTRSLPSEFINLHYMALDLVEACLA